MSLSDQAYIRYNRHIMLPDIGESGQQAFIDSRVAIIGMGGLGCPVAQYLVASGVGQLLLIDHDKVEVSNLQRQILFTTNDIGRLKTEVASERLSALNPLVKISTISDKFEAVDKTFLDGVDIIVDCTDNPQSRHYANQLAISLGCKLVSGAAIGFEGQVVSFDFSQQPCPCYHCIYPADVSTAQSCASSGVYSPLLGIVGSLQASITLNLLLGRCDPLNVLYRINSQGTQFSAITLPDTQGCQVCNPRV